MENNKRTKVLAGILAAVLVAGMFGPGIIESVMEPVTTAEAKLKSANRKLEDQKEKEFELMMALERIDEAQLASLPNDELDAKRLYSEWILRLAKQCRFALPEVDPGRSFSRGDKYLLVSAVVTAETDFAGISRFIHLINQSDLIHRISDMEIKSTGSQGNPRMDVTLTIEGLAVAGSAEQPEIFPRTQLANDVESDATTIQVANSKEFPKEVPFLAQVGAEMIQIDSISENGEWTITRAIEGTQAADHSADTVVQLFPIAFRQKNASFDDYSELLASSPFVKPTPPREYNPQLASISDKTILPGESVSATARINDLNADIGTPSFKLETEIEGMTIDASSGEIAWDTPDDIAPGEYIATVIAKQENNNDLELKDDFTVTVKLPNEAPTLEAPESAIVVLGREFILTVAARDDGPEESLTYALEGDSIPEGMSVDKSSGELKWQPPMSFKPGEYSVQVKVSDQGDPVKSATETVKLNVQDDSAITTVLTGAVSKDGVLEAWFWNRGDNTDRKLKIGEQLVIADIDAEIVAIGRRNVSLQDREGIWQLALGKNLRERVLIEPFEPTGDTPPESSSEEVQPTPSDELDRPSTPATDYDADPPAAPEQEPATSAESL